MFQKKPKTRSRIRELPAHGVGAAAAAAAEAEALAECREARSPLQEARALKPRLQENRRLRRRFMLRPHQPRSTRPHLAHLRRLSRRQHPLLCPASRFQDTAERPATMLPSPPRPRRLVRPAVSSPPRSSIPPWSGTALACFPGSRYRSIATASPSRRWKWPRSLWRVLRRRPGQ